MDENVLIAYASRMGSTAEIAVAIGDRLTHRGFQVDVRQAAIAPNARLYSAVVVGSSVYLGHWDKTAIAYLKNHAPDLAERPTWLFESGPCEAAAETRRSHVSHAVRKLCREIGLHEPMTFGGNLDPARATGRLTRWMSNGDLAGDFRDWEQISHWADGVADHLEADADQRLIGTPGFGSRHFQSTLQPSESEK
jgi:menaquinone-dependent protoporphyrinogen oxidase